MGGMDADLLRRLDAARDRLAMEPLSLAEAAHEACLSSFHFHRSFVRAFGQTPHAFAAERRFDRAKGLLLNTDLPVAEICLQLGYESPGTFTTRFCREFGAPPGLYRDGVRRFWAVSGLRTHRFIPVCFLRNRKIEEAAGMNGGLR